MAWHGDSCESRFRHNFKKPFDWCSFNRAMLLEGCAAAIALDHSFLHKAGKKTPGLGKYWSGCASAVKRGLENLGFAQIVPGVSDARFLFAVQTLPGGTKGRTPSYLEQMKDNRDNLREDVFERESVSVDGDEFVLFSAEVKCKSLKRMIKVVIVQFRCGAKTMRKILFRTDISMAAAQISLHTIPDSRSSSFFWTPNRTRA